MLNDRLSPIADDDIERFLNNESLQSQRVMVVVYEPVLTEDEFFHSEVINDLEAFKAVSDVIIANRKETELDVVAGKVYTSDLFGVDS